MKNITLKFDVRSTKFTDILGDDPVIIVKGVVQSMRNEIFDVMGSGASNVYDVSKLFP